MFLNFELSGLSIWKVPRSSPLLTPHVEVMSVTSACGYNAGYWWCPLTPAALSETAWPSDLPSQLWPWKLLRWGCLLPWLLLSSYISFRDMHIFSLFPLYCDLHVTLFPTCLPLRSWFVEIPYSLRALKVQFLFQFHIFFDFVESPLSHAHTSFPYVWICPFL